MASPARLLTVAAALLALSLLGPAASADWSHPRADPANTGAEGSLEPGNASVRWTVSPPFSLQAPPAVAEGTVIVLSDEVYAFAAATGDERWSFRPSWEGFELPRGWLDGGPVSDGESVVVSTSYPSLHALDLETGAERWRLNTSNRPSSLAIADEHVYAVHDENVSAHRLSTGAEDWRVDVGAPVAGLSPVDGTVYAATRSQAAEANRVVALEADSGERVWSRELETPSVGPPAVGDEALFLGYGTHAGDEHGVAAVDRSDGRILWTVETSGELTDPVATSEGAVVAVTTTETTTDPEERYASEQLEVLSAEDGEERWSLANVSGPAALADGIAYVGGANVQGLSLAAGDQERFFPSPPRQAQYVTVGEGLLVAWDGDSLYATDGGQVVHDTADPWSPGLLVALAGLAALAVVVATLWRRRSAT